MLTVNWNAGVLKNAPRKNRPNQRETWYPVHCSDCGADYELRKADIKRRGRCKFCSQRQGLLKSREWTEIMVEAWLNEDAPTFEAQKIHATPAQVFFVDFVVGSTAIEINGWGHRLRGQRDQALVEHWPGDVHFIAATDLRERPEWVRAQLRTIVQ